MFPARWLLTVVLAPPLAALAASCGGVESTPGTGGSGGAGGKMEICKAPGEACAAASECPHTRCGCKDLSEVHVEAACDQGHCAGGEARCDEECTAHAGAYATSSDGCGPFQACRQPNDACVSASDCPRWTCACKDGMLTTHVAQACTNFECADAPALCKGDCTPHGGVGTLSNEGCQ